MKPWAEKFYKGKAWVKCRYTFLKSKNFICEECGEAATLAHHKEHLTPNNINNPEITLNWENLLAVCNKCHSRLHHNTKSVREGLYFNENGELMKIKTKE